MNETKKQKNKTKKIESHHHCFEYTKKINRTDLNSIEKNLAIIMCVCVFPHHHHHYHQRNIGPNTHRKNKRDVVVCIE